MSAAMPNVWGPGQLLAFSGIDGFTDWREPFVLHTGVEPGSLVVRLPMESRIAFEGLRNVEFSTILGDAVAADVASGQFRFAFKDHHTLVGEMPDGVRIVANGKPCQAGPELIARDRELGLFCLVRGQRWALFVDNSKTPAGVAEHGETALRSDIQSVLDSRTAYVRNLEVGLDLDPSRLRLLRKAISVMKVNCEAPCGGMGRRWTTPDRWPHRHMWLWDTAFHGMGFSVFDPDTAKDVVLAMLEQVRDDGLLPHMVCPDGHTSQITQPPVLAWSVLTILKRCNDNEWASQCVPYLFRYLEWIRVNRDKNSNAIPEWFIEGSPLCRCGECGLDNSPRFDAAIELDAVDFASFLCNDYRCLAEIARRCGDPELHDTCAGNAARITAAVNKLLWSESEAFYFDRTLDGDLLDVKAVSGFFPLLAGMCDKKRAGALARNLSNPATFNGPLPVPSVSMDSGSYCKDMWRGPTWLNTNFVVHSGLRRSGFNNEADRIREMSLAAVQKWYEKEGCLFEFYDSLDITSPRRLDRKQRLVSGKGMAPISDYGWTAAITVAFILGKDM